MVIEKKLLFAGSIKKNNLQTVFDEGAAISLIRKDCAEKLGGIVLIQDAMEIRMADGVTKLHLNEIITVFFELNNLHLWDDFFVCEELGDEVILGAPTLQKWHIQLNYSNGEVITDPKVARLRI